MPADIVLLQKLFADTNEVINNLVASSLPVRANWAGLRCIEATYVINERSKEYYQVYVEEAPDTDELKNTIEQELLRKGWINVTVITESLTEF